MSQFTNEMTVPNGNYSSDMDPDRRECRFNFLEYLNAICNERMSHFGYFERLLVS